MFLFKGNNKMYLHNHFVNNTIDNIYIIQYYFQEERILCRRMYTEGINACFRYYLSGSEVRQRTPGSRGTHKTYGLRNVQRGN